MLNCSKFPRVQVIINCDIYLDRQVSRSATRSVRVPDRYGWTVLSATAMKVRLSTARTTTGATEAAITTKTSRSRATLI